MSPTETLEKLSSGPMVVIEPSRGWIALRLHELWEYRELLYFLTWREVKVRYKQTVIGAAWAIIQPVFAMILFTVFFGKLAQLPSDGIPYSVFCLTGLVPWNFFANGLTQCSNSLVGSANLITKVYFPRLAVPISAVLAGVIDFLLAFVLLIVYALYMKVVLPVTVLWLPAFCLLALITALGVGLWMSALNVEYRDIRFVMPFLIQFWMWGTPIVYSSSMVPQQWRTLYGLNPMVGVVDGFRWALLGTGQAPGAMTAASTLMAIAILISGAFYFRRMEKTFADRV